jgi:hypothetical protein
VSARDAAEPTLRDLLLAALYTCRRRDVETYSSELSRLLGERAAADDDLAIARGWLEEQDDLVSRQRAEALKVSLKLVLTGAPLVLATLLAGLLCVVMLLSG